MSCFDIHIFLLHCYIPAPIQTEVAHFRPFSGAGIGNVSDVMDLYLATILKQPSQPEFQRRSMLQQASVDDSTVVMTVENVVADNVDQAISSIQETLLIARDVLALRQLHRGVVAGYLAVQTDATPTMLFTRLRRPYTELRKIINLPMFDTEGSVVARFIDKARNDSLLRVYLSLFGDVLSHSDTIPSEIDNESRLVKAWTLLEAMAFSESGHKKHRVKSLLKRYGVPIFPDYRGSIGADLVDIAYSWRNIIAHAGGCKAASNASDLSFCERHQGEFSEIARDLSEICRMLLHSYAESLAQGV